MNGNVVPALAQKRVVVSPVCQPDEVEQSTGERPGVCERLRQGGVRYPLVGSVVMGRTP